MKDTQQLIDQIFEFQNEQGFWKVLPDSDPYYPQYLHYVPNFRSTLWTLILLADLGCDRHDPRVQRPLKAIQDHFFDPEAGLFSLKEDHFPIPCLNGNMIYLDSYFNGAPDEKSLKALTFFQQYQRFDDGVYEGEKNAYCSNTSCYGKHTCYWGIVKLLKGISFIPVPSRTKEITDLLDRCIRFVLLHKVCYSSHRPDQIMVQKMDLLTFPNMYKGDFLEILWLLKKEGVRSEALNSALKLLRSKQQVDGSWHLEREVRNMYVSIGALNQPNPFITKRANEVLEYYEGRA